MNNNIARNGGAKPIVTFFLGHKAKCTNQIAFYKIKWCNQKYTARRKPINAAGSPNFIPWLTKSMHLQGRYANP